MREELILVKKAVNLEKPLGGGGWSRVQFSLFEGDRPAACL